MKEEDQVDRKKEEQERQIVEVCLQSVFILAFSDLIVVMTSQKKLWNKLSGGLLMYGCLLFYFGDSLKGFRKLVKYHHAKAHFEFQVHFEK